MPFITDQQTLDDLRLFGRRGDDSIYGIFHRTATRHGAALLEDMFRHPLADAEAINQRSRLFEFFSSIGSGFPFQADLFDIAQQYLSITDERTRLSGDRQRLGNRLAGLVGEDNEYKTIYKGITALIKILQDLHLFLSTLQGASPYEREKMVILTLLSGEDMQPLLKEGQRIPYDKVVVYDSCLRFRRRDQIRRLLQKIYELDVYFSVGAVAVKRGFVFPLALPPGAGTISLRDVYHPLLNDPVSNTLVITPDNHILFLTGANMAGKSTFMKTIGIALFLGHMGFPVPAGRMEFCVMDGIFTTINLPDDLGMGVSHFYAEVQRIKKIAQQLHQGRRLFVIFDEMFRGTNVRDAYDATLALTTAFLARKESVLLLSTHIIEAGAALAEQQRAIDFIYLPTRMEGARPVYTYRLEKGITADRHGMVIIGNEGILDILKEGSGSAAENADGFLADRQTLDDLNLTGKYKPGSIYSLFNKVRTEGAERLLEAMFQQPLSDPEAIGQRTGRFRYLQDKAPVFPFTRDQMRQVEEYLRTGGYSHRLHAWAGILHLRLMQTLVKDQRYDEMNTAVDAVISFLAIYRTWLTGLEDEGSYPVRDLVNAARAILNDPRLQEFATPTSRPQDLDTSASRLQGLPTPMSWQELARCHYLFGTVLEPQLRQLCSIVYELDLGITVGNIARDNGYTYATALPKKDAVLEVVDLRHPGIDNAVGNALAMSRDSNLLFLTGANMAGKSTLMKSFGIAVYLAHMGFPVAAKQMVFSIRDGLYTSINVPDDLSRGHSHFYAEAVRVKEAAKAISAGRQLVVIFDELFKGTNVKDAYDATLAVTSAFADHRNCFFIISTHIIEVGEVLKQRRHLQLAYLPTIMEGAVPRYTYRLQTGITSDRHGMRIIENEGILALF